ncbi:MAG: VWA domain-containing protein [Alphaproteobacteria bacterium]|nr:VWA domain-containing protein [Alphaproteobacteria bacterium]
MTAALLAPAALALAALVGLPVLAHLTRQRPDKTVPYGAVLLLQRLARKQRRKRRLRDPLLLALRLLALLLVVAAVARPELRWPGAPPEVGGTGAVVVVLDNSLSMDLREGILATEGLDGDGTGTLLSVARQRAVDLVRSLPDGTLVGAVVIGGHAERLTPQLSADRALVAAALEDVRQTQGTTDLAGGLREARRMLGGQGGEVVVYTDEAGPVAVPGATEELELLTAQGGALTPEPVRPARPRNLAVTDARYGDGPEGGSVRIRVANFGDADVEAPVTVTLPDGAAITAFVEVPAGETAEEAVTVPRVAAGGVGRAQVDDSALAADDGYAFHLPRVGASRVLVVDGDPGATPVASEVYFLERALAPWGATAAARGGVLPDVTSPAGLASLDSGDHQVVFMANVGDPASAAGPLLEFVRSGGGLVIAVGDNVTADRYNAALGRLLPSPLREPVSLVSPGEPGVPVELPDTALELFAPFARGGRAAFGQARTRRLMTLQPFEDDENVRTLLRLQGGQPLLVERRVGQGRVLLWTTTLDLGWTDLPLQAMFMPLVQRTVSYLGGDAGGGGERRSVTVGDTVSVPLPDSALDVTVEGPRGPVAVVVRSGSATFVAEAAGAYVVETPGAPALAWVAANVDPVESDVRPGPTLVETAAEVDPDRFLRRVSLSPWLLAGGLAFAFISAVAALRRVGHEDEAAEPADEVPLAS